MTTHQLINITRAGKFVGSIEARHVETPDHLRYELAQMTGVHAPSVLRGHVTTYSDGTRHVWPVDTKGKRLGRPYGCTPYGFEAKGS